MGFWQQVGSNQVLVSSVIGWVVAQFLKTVIDCSLNKSFSAERLVGSGGMPSSHSSTVCALVFSTAFCFGISSFEFAVSFVLASIVMYDAIGVRQETGKQAKLLNMIMEQNLLELDNHQIQERLKEFVGHTPLQVFAGAILGIAIACIVNLWYL